MVYNTRISSGLETVLEKTGRSLADRFGIRVICRGNSCCTDGKTIYLPSLPDELPDEIIGAIRGFLDHEAAHLAGRSNFRIAKWFQEKYGGDGMMFLNCLEDLRVEEYMRQRFPGSSRNLLQAYKTSCAEAMEKSTREQLPVMNQLAFGIYTRGNQYPDLPFVGAEVCAVLDMIADEVAKASACRNTKEVARLAEKAWSIVQQLFPPQSAPKTTQQPPAPEKSKTGMQGVGRQSGSPSQPQQHGSPSPTTHQHPANTGALLQQGESFGGIVNDVVHAIVKLVNDYSSGNPVYRVWDTSQDSVTTPRIPRGGVTHQERMATLLPHVAGVRQKLLQTLLAEPKARWLGDKEAGYVNPRALHRLAVPADAPAGNSRIFREQVKTRRIHTTCMLLVDQSSSMRGKRVELAAQTSLVFCEALSRLGIPCSVLGFSTFSNPSVTPEISAKHGMTISELEDMYRIYPLRHTYYKHFHEPLRMVSGRFDCLRSHAWTPLGESMLFAAKELVQRKEERKVLFVMTDGMPQVGRGISKAAYEHAKSSIKRIENAGVEVALVGILENRVLQLHHRSVVVNSLYDLPKTVMRQMQTILVNKRKYAI